MKRNIFLTISLALMLLVALPSVAQKENKLSKKEIANGWVLMFNGKNFDGWRKCNGTAMPSNWAINEESMNVFTGEGKKPGQGSDGDIVYTVKKFKNFELSIDWKAGKAANSGVFYCVREVPGKPIYYAAPEVQVLDNVDASDNKIDSHLAGSLYDMIAADPKTVKPTGSWNTMVIKLKDGKATHTMNGKLVVSYTLWTPEWDAMVAKSKFKTFPGFIEGIAKEGYIGLQDHGGLAQFRNIKIKIIK